MNIENLGSFEKDALLRWFLYYMPMGGPLTDGTAYATRYALMREYPEMYNKLAGRPIVRVMHLSSNTPA
jgi:hypothetical protein